MSQFSAFKEAYILLTLERNIWRDMAHESHNEECGEDDCIVCAKFNDSLLAQRRGLEE